MVTVYRVAMVKAAKQDVIRYAIWICVTLNFVWPNMLTVITEFYRIFKGFVVPAMLHSFSSIVRNNLPSSS